MVGGYQAEKPAGYDLAALESLILQHHPKVFSPSPGC